MNEKPTLLDLFSGIGGFSLAGERAGFRTIGFSEIDPYACAVLRKHWPGVPNYGNIRNIAKELIGHVDVITGGFPCQPFSLAGSRRGDSDERHLWPELCRVIGEIRPQWCLLENVPGLLSNDAGRVFGGVLRDLAALGHDVIWNCVPASAVGANHRRDRVWILAYSLQGWQRRKSWESEAQQDALDSNSMWRLEPQRGIGNKRGWDQHATWWSSTSEPQRVDDGIPEGSHRRDLLGNSIVPQVAEIFLKEIMCQITTNPTPPQETPKTP